MNHSKIKKIILNSIDIKNSLLEESYLSKIYLIGKELIAALKKNKKILIAGNGGSAADAQHFAAELVNTFIKKRKALPAIALTVDSSILTSSANDHNFDIVFARQIEAHGTKGDIFIGISTSGDSKNILKALKIARRKGLLCICLLGKNGGKAKSLSDLSIIVPSSETPRIQEAHILIIHLICQLIDDAF